MLGTIFTIVLAVIFLLALLIVPTLIFAHINKKQGYDDPEKYLSKTINCPICAKEVSRTANRCPNCGHDFVGTATKVFIVIGIIVLVFIVIWILSPRLEFIVRFKPV